MIRMRRSGSSAIAESMRWVPSTLGDPCEVRLLSGGLGYTGCGPQVYAGECWIPLRGGSWSNGDAYAFPAPPAGADPPDGIEIRRRGVVVLSGALPANIVAGDAIRIAAGALALRPPAEQEGSA